MSIYTKVGAVALSVIMMIANANCIIKSHAESGICGISSGTNIEKQSYDIYGDTVKSYLVEKGSSLMRVQALEDNSVYVEYYDKDYNLLDIIKIPAELPVFGGFHKSEDGYFYIVTGGNNISESDTAEVFRVTKYDSGWNRISHASLYGENTTKIFDGGSVRFAEYGNYLVIKTAHSMYKSADGRNHQSNVTVQLDKNSMTITDSLTGIMNNDFGYVSHSFNQYVEIDNNHIVSVDHGDAFPRSLIIGRYTSPVTSGKFIDGATIYNHADIYDIPGEHGDNLTGVSVGGFEVSDSAYITAINSVDMGNYNPYAERNIYVISTPKVGAGFGESSVKQITKDGGYNTPHLVKLGNNHFMLLWSKHNRVYYASLDGLGNITSRIYDFNGNLSDCVPIVANGKLLWYSYEGNNVDFYEISLSDISKNDVISTSVGHEYKVISSENGVSVLRCSRCGNEMTKNVPTELMIYANTDMNDPYFHSVFKTELAIDEKLYFLTVTKPDGVENSEIEVVISNESVICYDANRQILNPIAPGKSEITFRLKYNPDVTNSFEITVAHNHDYSDEWSIEAEADCTNPGSKYKCCTICGQITDITEIPAIGHKYSERIIEREASCTETGLSYRKCMICGELTDIENMPKTDHDFSYGVILPTYDSEGYTVKECKICGYSEKYDYTDRLVKETTVVTTKPIAEISISKNTSKTTAASENEVIETTSPVVTTTTTAVTTTTKKTVSKPVEVTTTKATTAITTTTKIATSSNIGITTSDNGAPTESGYWHDISDPTTLPPGFTFSKPDTIAGIVVKFVDHESFRVDWDKMLECHGYYVQELVDGKWIDVKKLEGANAPSYTRTGLNPSTKYCFRVCSYIGDSKGDYVEFEINTTADITSQLPVVTVSNISQMSAFISWNAIDGAEYYTVELMGIYGTETITVYSNCCSFNNLTPGSMYCVTVIPWCSNGRGQHGVQCFDTLS